MGDSSSRQSLEKPNEEMFEAEEGLKQSALSTEQGAGISSMADLLGPSSGTGEAKTIRTKEMMWRLLQMQQEIIGLRGQKQQ